MLGNHVHRVHGNDGERRPVGACKTRWWPRANAVDCRSKSPEVRRVHRQDNTRTGSSTRVDMVRPCTGYPYITRRTHLHNHCKSSKLFVEVSIFISNDVGMVNRAVTLAGRDRFQDKSRGSVHEYFRYLSSLTPLLPQHRCPLHPCLSCR